jgi:hypothetical protein
VPARIGSERPSEKLVDLLPVSRIAESWKIPVLKRGPETVTGMKKSKFTEAQIAFAP